MRDELYNEFENFFAAVGPLPEVDYGLVGEEPIVDYFPIPKTSAVPTSLKFQRAIADVIHPHNKELNKFVYTEFYKEIVKRENEK